MFSLFFSPYGMIDRLHFFIGFLTTILFSMLGLGLLFIPELVFINPTIKNLGPIASFLMYTLGTLFLIASLWTTICVHSKRLADLNLKRFWVVTPFVAAFGQMFVVQWYMRIIFYIILITYLICLFFWPSRN